jgi:hypothetical protein
MLNFYCQKEPPLSGLTLWTNAKHFPAPDRDGVDWLLLPAKVTSGYGSFSKVTYIQRLYTDGGKPPAGCNLNQIEVLVDYSAQYLFYVPAAQQ